MKNVIISGWGKRYVFTFILYLSLLLLGVVGGTFFCVKAANIKGTDRELIIILGVMCLFAGVIAAPPILKALCKACTKIYVCQDGIRGKGLVDSDYKLVPFELDYNQVSQVFLLNQTEVLIRTDQGKYSCFSSNAMEITEEILGRIDTGDLPEETRKLKTVRL